MKQLLFLIYFSLLTPFAFAQISVGANTFPVAGDSLLIGVDNMPNRNLITVTAAGGNQLWDFSSLQSPTIVASAVKANANADFPSANIVLGVAGGEAYIKTSSDRQEIVGFAGKDPFGFNQNVVVKFTDAALFRRTLAYNLSYTDDSAVPYTIASSDIPNFDSLNLPINPDSIRITYKVKTNAKVDAWGKLSIPIGQYDVLRVKEENFTSAKIEGKVPIFGWVDLTSFITSLPNIPNLTDTTQVYSFFNNQTKEPIARLNVRNDTLRTVEYKRTRSGTTPIVDVKSNKPRVDSYPNPATDKIRLDFNDFEIGNYTIRFYDLTGKRVYEESIKIVNSNQTIRMNIGRLGRGTFFYTIVNKKGRTLATKRIVVVGA